MKQELPNQGIIRADETLYNVIESDKAKTCYWLMASGQVC
ncbi:hypothetical protein L248_0461 [Schleiferilactobacillus shenzhenensis LY-73]|uniref:Uncharacterized protein n=1 Tax=Schleiferilactobacillus shenzhenensis LY-73 TaxID=1231336 RepID=U4TTU7_9LACO|nr:hypothetical protein L248_0461 [Schleiferilactobacillus shenzhenensis LY-73]